MTATKKSLFFAIVTGICLLLCFTVSGLSQSLYPKKDLIFTQVFAGPFIGNVYTASIAVTNRGTLPYSGVMLTTTGAGGTAWNPRVNNVQVAGGIVNVEIPPDATRVFLITDTVFKVGYAAFLSDDFSMDNHLEGNLTYFSTSGSTLMDAVGVPESQEFLITSLPFDNFLNVGLSLAHPDINATGAAANVNVILYDEDGSPVGTSDFTIAPHGHFSAYLRELPWDGGAIPQSFGPVGKVEIQSDQAISGIAMLVTPGSAGDQISTLPLGGTPLTYDVTFTRTSDAVPGVYTGELTLWIEGFFVKGYLQITSVNSTAVTDPYDTIPILVNGQLVGDELDLTFFTGPANTWPTNPDDYGAVVYMYVAGFTPSGDVNGDDPSEFAIWTAYHSWEDDAVVGGTLVIDNTIIN